MVNQRDAKYEKMTTQPVGRLVCEMAVPSMVCMLATGFYNVVDTFFVGKIDTQSTAALGIVFVYMTLLQAISFFLGQGSGIFISNALGARKFKEAEAMAATGFFSAIILTTFMAICGFLFMDPLLRFFGSTETILPVARPYFGYILLCTPFMSGVFVMNNQMRLQGNATLSMIGILSGVVLNIALDPLFIFGFKMGVAGAGLATAISQFISFWIMFAIIGRNGGIHIRLRLFKPTLEQFREIVAGGLPSLVRQSLISVVSLCVNNLAAGYGDAAVAAFSVVNRVMALVMAALLGFGQGFQPVCGFNYGAGLYTRVRKAFNFSVMVATAYCVVISLLGILFATGIITLFRAEDADVIDIGAQVLRYQCYTFPLVGFVVIANMYLQNIRKTVSATLVAIGRHGLFFIPLLYLGTWLFGMFGMIIAQPIADVFSIAMAAILCGRALRKMP